MTLHRLAIRSLAYSGETQLAKSYYEYYCCTTVSPSKAETGRAGLQEMPMKLCL